MSRVYKHLYTRIRPSNEQDMKEAIKRIEKNHNINLSKAEFIRLAIDNLARDTKSNKDKIHKLLEINRYN